MRLREAKWLPQVTCQATESTMNHRSIFPEEAEFSTTPRTFSFVWVQRAKLPALVIPKVRSNAEGSYVGLPSGNSPSCCSVDKSCLTLCDPTDWSPPGFLSFNISSWSLLRLTSIESVMPSNHLILCRPLLLLPSIFPSIRVFSSESVLHTRWPKY